MWGLKGIHLPDGDPASVQHGGRLRGAAVDRQHSNQNGHFGTSPTDFIEVEVTGMFGPFLC